MKFEEWWDSIGGDKIYHNRIHNRPFMLKILAEEMWDASQIHNASQLENAVVEDMECSCPECGRVGTHMRGCLNWYNPPHN